jgi:LPS sulfotransferase NodH
MIRIADFFPDTPPDAEPMRTFDWTASGVALPYVIFITGRCGSTLLTHILAATGLCGDPDEFFNEERIAELVEKWGATDFPAYFQNVVRQNTSNSRFGFEIDPFRFEQLGELISFADIFPARGCVFFWMTRRDIVSQGWSYAKAKKTGLWQRFADGSEKRLHGSSQDLENEVIEDSEWWREIILILKAERIMEDYFVATGITPYRLDYEMLVTDRHRTIISVLLALSCSPDEIANHLGPPFDHTERNRDDDRHRALLAFYARYRHELLQVEGHRNALDVEALRQELNARYALMV